MRNNKKRYEAYCKNIDKTDVTEISFGDIVIYSTNLCQRKVAGCRLEIASASLVDLQRDVYSNKRWNLMLEKVRAKESRNGECE